VGSETLAIQLLGEFGVSVGPRTIAEREWRLRKAKSLVKLLALAPHHRLHREHIIDRLWPDLGPEDGANNLHRTLYVVRHILEPDLPPRGASSYLQLRHDLLVLKAPGGLWIDVEARRSLSACTLFMTRTLSDTCNPGAGSGERPPFDGRGGT
jgi:DNA-binding SARP family transcriptional activator